MALLRTAQKSTPPIGRPQHFEITKAGVEILRLKILAVSAKISYGDGGMLRFLRPDVWLFSED